MQRLVILGSTGSIGQSALDVVQRHLDQFSVLALSAYSNLELLFQQCRLFCPQFVVVKDAAAALQFSARLRAEQVSSTTVVHGQKALVDVARLIECDTVLVAIVGAAGLLPTMAAARAGKKILLANKEALVMSGALLMHTVKISGALLLPIDSEHSAIFQCLANRKKPEEETQILDQLILTASGGPFLGRAWCDLRNVSVEQACAHPTWKMGRKISIDSATMLNKGLEVIEARWLFDIPLEKIKVVIHPQSIVHGMVCYIDGSLLAQLGNPDMRTPLSYALAYPKRIACGVSPLDFVKASTLTFLPVDIENIEKNPCLSLAYSALRSGSAHCIALNAANEIAVAAFLNQQIYFTDIASIITEVLEKTVPQEMTAIEEILESDQAARRQACQIKAFLQKQKI